VPGAYPTIVLALTKSKENVKEKIVNFYKSFVVRVISHSLLTISFSAVVFAQEAPAKSALIIDTPAQSQAVAAGNNLYCAGFIETGSVNPENKVIGGQDEADKFAFSQNNFLYINMGRNKGVKVGDMFSVVRPRGHVKSKWSSKGDLGFYVQEVGAVQVVDVKAEVAVARVKTSCSVLLLGDLVQSMPTRTSPLTRNSAAMDPFGDPSGKAQGRIVLARDGQEMLTRDQIAYVDLGREDNVQVGDHLTIFRPLAKGNLRLDPDKESVSARDYGFESGTYKGGTFSNQATAKTGEHADRQEIRTRDVRNQRPKDLRKVVGEAVVLNVKEKTATIVITRTGQEIHTGDWVEMQ